MDIRQFIKKLDILGFWVENLEPNEIDIVSNYENVTCGGSNFPRELADIDVSRHCLYSGGILPDSVWLVLNKAISQDLNYNMIFNQKSWLYKAEKKAFKKPHIRKIKHYPNFKYQTCSFKHLKAVCKKLHVKVIRNINTDGDIIDYIVPLNFDETRINDVVYINSYSLANICTTTLYNDTSSDFCIFANRNIPKKLLLAIVHYTNFLKTSKSKEKIIKRIHQHFEKQYSTEYLSKLTDIKEALYRLSDFSSVSKKYVKLYNLIVNSIINYGLNLNRYVFIDNFRIKVPQILNNGQAIKSLKASVKDSVDSDKFKETIKDSQSLIRISQSPKDSWFINANNHINYLTPQDMKNIQQFLEESLNKISKFEKVD